MSNDDLNVYLLLEPINDGRILPIVKVGDKALMYANDGLHSIPAAMIQHREAWKKLGKTSLKNVKNATKKAFELFLSDFLSFNPITSNPIQFTRALLRLLLGEAEVMDWSDMSEQDWDGIRIDTVKILDKKKRTSGSCSSSGSCC